MASGFFVVLEAMVMFCITLPVINNYIKAQNEPAFREDEAMFFGGIFTLAGIVFHVVAFWITAYIDVSIPWRAAIELSIFVGLPLLIGLWMYFLATDQEDDTENVAA